MSLCLQNAYSLFSMAQERLGEQPGTLTTSVMSQLANPFNLEPRLMKLSGNIE